MSASAETTPTEVDRRYLARLQAQAVVSQGDLITAIERADRHMAQAQVTAHALEDVESEEAVLLDAVRVVLDSNPDPDSNAAALAASVFETFLTKTLGWTPSTPQQCLDLLASQRESLATLGAESLRLALAAEAAATALAAVRARREAVLHALTVGADPAMTVEAYRTVLAEVASGEPAP